jgi:hypothetical protein
MKSRAFVLTICLAAVAMAPILAQQPPARAPQPPRAGTPAPAPTPTPPAPATSTRREGQPVNVKVEFTLTDQRGSGAPIKRTVTLVVADSRGGSIRSHSEVMGVGGGVPLNIDANPELLADGKIRLGFNIQYDWPAPIEGGRDVNTAPRGTVFKTSMHESVGLILENGKSMIATQSADPIGDRQVTVEVKATILR